MKNSNGTENSKNEIRLAITTGIAVTYTTGEPYDNEVDVVDGKAMVTPEQLSRAITSRECKVLTKLFVDAFHQFQKMYPDSNATAQLIPANGVDEIDPIEIL